MSSSKPAHLRVRQRTAALAAAVAFLLAAPAVALEAGFPPWDKFAEVDVIDIVTSDADGSVRETPLWFVMVDGAPYLRTSATRWLANIERGSQVMVRIEGLEYNIAAVVVTGTEIVEKVDAASLEKYGWQERALFLRFSTPDILKLVPRR